MWLSGPPFSRTNRNTGSKMIRYIATTLLLLLVLAGIVTAIAIYSYNIELAEHDHICEEDHH